MADARRWTIWVAAALGGAAQGWKKGGLVRKKVSECKLLLTWRLNWGQGFPI